MRSAGFALIAMAWVGLDAPAHAQTYDPAFPVCMQIYGPVGYMDCRYATLQQCKVLAVGRSAMCLVNPYFQATSGRGSKRAR